MRGILLAMAFLAVSSVPLTVQAQAAGVSEDETCEHYPLASTPLSPEDKAALDERVTKLVALPTEHLAPYVEQTLNFFLDKPKTAHRNARIWYFLHTSCSNLLSDTAHDLGEKQTRVQAIADALGKIEYMHKIKSYSRSGQEPSHLPHHAPSEEPTEPHRPIEHQK